MRTTAAITFAALIGITACQGDDDVAPTLPTDPSTTTVSTVADPATTMTPVPTTTPTTSTTPPTTTPSTDPPIDEAAEKQAVIDAAIASWTAFNEAQRDPSNESKLQRVRDLHDGSDEQRLVEVIENYRALNQSTRLNPDLPADVAVDRSSVLINDEVASVEICEVNSDILVEVSAGPDGSDAVVDDSIRTVRSLLLFQRIDGGWIAIDGDRISVDLEGTSCDL